MMWIVGEAEEEASTSTMEKLAALVSESGGEMVSNEPWGRRSLAYPIASHQEGSYHLARFKMPTEGAPSLERAFKAEHQVIRYQLIRTDQAPQTEASQPDQQTES